MFLIDDSRIVEIGQFDLAIMCLTKSVRFSMTLLRTGVLLHRDGNVIGSNLSTSLSLHSPFTVIVLFPLVHWYEAIGFVTHTYP